MIHDISVIIPIKDKKEIDYLEDILIELCKQTEKFRLDIIIVVKEDFHEIVRMTYKLREKFEYVPPINVKEASFLSIVDSRNYGVQSTIGDILVFLDCDNILNNDYFIHDLVSPLVDETSDFVMTYTPVKYSHKICKTEKDMKLVKYNNLLLKLDVVPKVPFAVWKEVFLEMGGLEEKNTMIRFCSKLLWKHPGGIKKEELGTEVLPRHILERANKRITKK